MRFRKRFSICLFFALFSALPACDFTDYFEYSPNVTKVENEYKSLNAKSLSLLQTEADEKPVRIAVIADSHSYYGDLEYVVSVINAMDDIDFVVVAGDITEKGLLKEFEWSADVLKKLNVPFLVNIGNHECLGNGRSIYSEMFGPESFSFLFSGVRITFLNLNIWECGISDISFIEDYIEGEEKAKIVISHVPPDSEHFSEEERGLYGDILERNGVGLSVHGHAHSYAQESDFDGKGFDYLRVDQVRSHAVAVIDVSEDGDIEVNHAYY